jgi:hypothetical protein
MIGFRGTPSPADQRGLDHHGWKNARRTEVEIRADSNAPSKEEGTVNLIFRKGFYNKRLKKQIPVLS